ncbi:DUF6134 family protein [Albimonas sp. CAU 1670]|uniref:DUF6134 family protein n=1 Tax=Albimonas sp. CAU 1670 TaxID=3032599 RepID=UPI0023DCEB0D|nr:DUF6134 family protein [Albimonas sp. CAU 1670]MDF2231338.1 DUF6134 family protein [Albimonas sp. CAU 1670]
MTRRPLPCAPRRAPTACALSAPDALALAAPAEAAIDRRALLAGGLATGAALALARPLRAAESASRRFEVLRDGASIGEQTTTVARAGEALDVTVRVRILVKVLGIGAYRYELDSQERWEGGRLVALDGQTNDDGERQVARVRREGGRLVSSGDWSGELPDDVATTTYWTPAFLQRSTWISTQTGRPLSVAAAQAGAAEIPGPSGPLPVRRWQVSGDIDLTLFYDDRGEWMGSAFDAGGETARFRALSAAPALAPLWPSA